MRKVKRILRIRRASRHRKLTLLATNKRRLHGRRKRTTSCARMCQPYFSRRCRKKNTVGRRRRLITRAASKQTRQQTFSKAYDAAYQNGFDAGFAKGFEDGHQLAYSG